MIKEGRKRGKMKTTKRQLERNLRIVEEELAASRDMLYRVREISAYKSEEGTFWNPKITTYASLHKMAEAMALLVKEAVELVRIGRQR